MDGRACTAVHVRLSMDGRPWTVVHGRHPWIIYRGPVTSKLVTGKTHSLPWVTGKPLVTSNGSFTVQRQRKSKDLGDHY